MRFFSQSTDTIVSSRSNFFARFVQSRKLILEMFHSCLCSRKLLARSSPDAFSLRGRRHQDKIRQCGLANLTESYMCKLIPFCKMEKIYFNLLHLVYYIYFNVLFIISLLIVHYWIEWIAIIVVSFLIKS